MKNFNSGDKVQYQKYGETLEALYIAIHKSSTDDRVWHVVVNVNDAWSAVLLNDDEIKLFASAHYTALAKFHKHDFAIETNAQDIEVIILDERDDHDLTYMCFDTLNGCKRAIAESALKVI
jgi:hypothetical protein